ncbi:hypothetical protein SeMB42_g02390 [Synchytrium endobioticum]|uniref:Repressor of RNA polymerase III transcription MAF1 n=1 Tax=Synchytrium endobioticum TaxID=286115 RepID=A0A507DEA4_9FUNG|nr:hypothetical protein SeLEV6574_g02225 [Synchytrium endobioticum]TPX50012.1 hypothetical protein SeMB42_g02390 [Synchytrium endobioticum]
MKYLEIDALEELNTALSCVDTGDSRVFGRIEAYSCKNTYDDKKLKHRIESKFNGGSHSPDNEEELIAIGSGAGIATSSHSSSDATVLGNNSSSSTTVVAASPSAIVGSPFGPLSQATSRKTLFFLLATLNAAFPDYDFSDVKPEYFNKAPSISVVANKVNTLLVNTGNDTIANSVGPKIWAAIDDVVNTSECSIFSFEPDADIEPDAEEGNLWSFYYFFFNRRLKRMVFFSCRAVSFLAPPRHGEEDIVVDDDLEFLDDEGFRLSPSTAAERYRFEHGECSRNLPEMEV